GAACALREARGARSRAEALRRWRLSSAQRRRCRERLGAALGRLRSALLGACLASWSEVVARRVRWRHQCGLARSHLASGCALLRRRAAVELWRNRSVLQRQRRGGLRGLGRRAAARLAREAFQLWQARLRWLKLKQLAGRHGNLRRRLLLLGDTAWAWRFCARLLRLERRAAELGSRRLLGRCFLGLRLRGRFEKLKRLALQRGRARRAVALVGQALDLWACRPKWRRLKALAAARGRRGREASLTRCALCCLALSLMWRRLKRLATDWGARAGSAALCRTAWQTWRACAGWHALKRRATDLGSQATAVRLLRPALCGLWAAVLWRRLKQTAAKLGRSSSASLLCSWAWRSWAAGARWRALKGRAARGGARRAARQLLARTLRGWRGRALWAGLKRTTACRWRSALLAPA
ncbi:unnamed protein product, partial [Prorocentrum cordatum]